MSIQITLRGAPGFRTGTVRIGDGVHERQWPVVLWIKKEMGEIEAHTACGKMITLATDNGSGGITIGGERWLLRGCGWTGATMTGTATLAVSDAEMAAMLPGCGWE